MERNRNAFAMLRNVLAAVLIAACAFGVVLPAVAYADDDEDRGLERVYLLGRALTGSGVISPAKVPHEGTISYDAAAKELTLSNATLDLDDYDMQGAENNYAAAISSWTDLKIRLEGQNYIKSGTNTYAADKEYVYGIAGHSGKVSIAGQGLLDITLEAVSGKEFNGIDTNRGFEVSESILNVHMKGPQASNGIDMGIGDFMISDAAKVKVQAEGEGSTAVDGCGLFARSYVCTNAVLEAISDGTAFHCYLLSDDLQDTPAFVNLAATSEGATQWDKQTPLVEYKYVRFAGKEDGPSRASGSIYILGRKVSETGEVPASKVPHEGTITYDADTMTVTLQDAVIDLNNYKSVYKGNILPGIYATAGLNVVLQGTNQIISTGDDYAKYAAADPKDKKEYVSGIDAWDAINISGETDASLAITLAKTAKEENKAIRFTGVESDGSVSVDGVWLTVDMGSYGKCDGMFPWEPLKLTGGAAVRANADANDGRAVNGVNSIGNSQVGEDCMLEMISNGKAFNCYVPSASLKETPCVVNTEASEEGAEDWDKTTGLYEYKYVRFGEKKRSPEPPDPGKMDNTLTVKGKTATVKYAKLKKKAQTIKRKDAMTVAKAQGPVTYKLYSVSKAKYRKYFKVSARSGNITVKKGLKKGTYTVKVKVTAAGSDKYKAGSKTAAVKVKVKK